MLSCAARFPSSAQAAVAQLVNVLAQSELSVNVERNA